jgi:hypothetical protein
LADDVTAYAFHFSELNGKETGCQELDRRRSLFLGVSGNYRVEELPVLAEGFGVVRSSSHHPVV